MLKLNTILSLSKETESKPNQNYCSSASSEEDKKITEEYKKLICQNKSTDKKFDIVQKAIDQNTIDYLYKLKDGKYYNIIMPFLIKYRLRPSQELLNEFASSETGIRLLKLPSFEVLNSKIGMNQQTYDNIKQVIR